MAITSKFHNVEDMIEAKDHTHSAMINHASAPRPEAEKHHNIEIPNQQHPDTKLQTATTSHPSQVRSSFSPAYHLNLTYLVPARPRYSCNQEIQQKIHRHHSRTSGASSSRRHLRVLPSVERLAAYRGTPSVCKDWTSRSRSTKQRSREKCT